MPPSEASDGPRDRYAAGRNDQVQFAIIQGGLDCELRQYGAPNNSFSLDFPGMPSGA